MKITVHLGPGRALAVTARGAGAPAGGVPGPPDKGSPCRIGATGVVNGRQILRASEWKKWHL